MKILTTTLILLITTTYCFSQRVGIGTVTPAARLHVMDSNVVFTGPLNVPDTTNVNPPSQGPGSRMMWYPQKAAFRVGAVSGTQWNKTSIGRNSFGAGYNPLAQGFATIAMGAHAVATGDSSVSMGAHARAVGLASLAFGNYVLADAQSSTAIGYYAEALGTFATAIGDHAQAHGMGSMALGPNTLASGVNATAIGNAAVATNWSATAIGFNTLASGSISFASGNSTFAEGDASTAMGNYTSATGITATAMGNATIASGSYSTAMGLNSKSVGSASLAAGSACIAQGQYSIALGEHTIAKSNNALVIGRNNDTTAVNTLFEIGNGTHTLSRRNVLTVLNNGNVGIGITNPTHRMEVFLGPSGGAVYHPETSLGIESNGSHYINLITSDNGETGVLFGNKTHWGADGGITYRAVNATTDPRAMYFRLGGMTRTIISSVGDMWISGVYSQSSDARLKKDITRLPDVLSSLQQLNGYTYYWNDQNRDKDQQIGLLAQEVQKVYPQLVKQTSEGYLSINYNGMIPVLLEALKEQSETLKEQQKQIDELKQRLGNERG